MTTRAEQFAGLEWVKEHKSLRPRWTTDPDIEGIREVIEGLLPLQQKVTITFFSRGAFNKLYTIRIGEKELIMPVPLAVDPQWKTLSEVATLGWVRRNTPLPVPEVSAYAVSRDNPIGFEWILMSKLPGRPLFEVWESMDFAAQKLVTHEVVVLFSSMFKKQLRGIGNLYSLPKLGEGVGDIELPEVQRIASMDFFWGDHVSQLVPRGPFSSSKDWLQARLLLHEHDCNSTIARYKNSQNPDEDDELDAEMAEAMLGLISMLKLLLDEWDLFPISKDGHAEPSMFFHDDLAQRNIMVDEAGVLTGIVDWECVSALPLWKACDFPSFLQRPPASEEPLREQYGDDGEQFFLIDKMDYENTRLREYFLEEMLMLEPGWVKVFEASERLRDFDRAVRECTDKGMMHYIFAWMKDVRLRKKEIFSLSFRESNNIGYRAPDNHCRFAFDAVHCPRCAFV